MPSELSPHFRADGIAAVTDGGAEKDRALRRFPATFRHPLRQLIYDAGGQSPPAGMDRPDEWLGPMGDEDGKAVGGADADQQVRSIGQQTVRFDPGCHRGVHPFHKGPMNLLGKEMKAGFQGLLEVVRGPIGRPAGPDMGSKVHQVEFHEFVIIALMLASLAARTLGRWDAGAPGSRKVGKSRFRSLDFAPYAVRRTLNGLSRYALLAAAPFIFQVPPEFADRQTWLERNAPAIYEHYADMMGIHPAGVFPGAPLVVEVVRADPRIFAWADGIYAHGRLVLKAGRVDEFPELFRHELAHAFIEAAGGGRVAVWFNEGLAMRLSGGDEDSLTAFWTAVRRRPRLADLADDFPGGGMAVRMAYARSRAAVDGIVEEAGWEGVLAVLDGCRRGLPFDQALLYGTGRNTTGWEKILGRPEWVGYLFTGFGSLLWFLLAAVVVVAYIRLRRRQRAVIAGWDEEDKHDPDVPRV